MKKNYRFYLLLGIFAAFMLLMASCGVNEDSFDSDTVEILFLKIDKEQTLAGSTLVLSLLILYWVFRGLLMRRLRKEYPDIKYGEEVKEYLKNMWRSDDDQNAENGDSGGGRLTKQSIAASILVGPFVCRVSPVFFIYSWFLNCWSVIFWVLTILTCLVIEYIRRFIDDSSIEQIWIVIWSIIMLITTILCS